MRRVTLTVSLLLLLAAPAEAARIREPPAHGTIVQEPFGLRQRSGDVVVSGTAGRRQGVSVDGACTVMPCRASAVADRRGRWRATLHVIVPTTQRTLPLRVTGADGATVRRTVAIAPPPWSLAPPFTDAEAPVLVQIGDSLAVGTAAPLRAALPDWRVTGDGRVSRPLAEGLDVLAAAKLPPGPSVLVMSLFTNDEPVEVEALDAAVRASFARLPGRSCVVWSTIVRPKLGGRSYAAANHHLEALAADPAFDGRLLLVPWARTIGRHRKWLREDGVHPTQEGYAERARLTAEAARTCQTREGW